MQMISPMENPLEAISKAIKDGLKRGEVGARRLHCSPALYARLLGAKEAESVYRAMTVYRTYGLPTIEDPSLLGESFELRIMEGTR